jgi:hypothetical protein
LLQWDTRKACYVESYTIHESLMWPTASTKVGMFCKFCQEIQVVADARAATRLTDESNRPEDSRVLAAVGGDEDDGVAVVERGGDLAAGVGFVGVDEGDALGVDAALAIGESLGDLSALLFGFGLVVERRVVQHPRDGIAGGLGERFYVRRYAAAS